MSYIAPNVEEFAQYIFQCYMINHSIVPDNVEYAVARMLHSYLAEMPKASKIMTIQKLLTPEARGTINMSMRYARASEQNRRETQLEKEIAALVKLHYLDNML